MPVNFSCIGQPLYGQNQWLALFLKGQHFIRQLCPLFYLQKRPHPKAAAACGWGFGIVAGAFPCSGVSIVFRPFFFYPFFVFPLPVKHASHRCLVGLGGACGFTVCNVKGATTQQFLYCAYPRSSQNPPPRWSVSSSRHRQQRHQQMCYELSSAR